MERNSGYRNGEYRGDRDDGGRGERMGERLKRYGRQLTGDSDEWNRDWERSRSREGSFQSDRFDRGGWGDQDRRYEGGSYAGSGYGGSQSERYGQSSAGYSQGQGSSYGGGQGSQGSWGAGSSGGDRTLAYGQGGNMPFGGSYASSGGGDRYGQGGYGYGHPAYGANQAGSQQSYGSQQGYGQQHSGYGQQHSGSGQQSGYGYGAYGGGGYDYDRGDRFGRGDDRSGRDEQRWGRDEQRWGRDDQNERREEGGVKGFFRNLFSPEQRDQRRGKPPRGFQRSDDRIREEICELIMRETDIDASDVDIRVANGEVTLSGMVNSRGCKRDLEDLAERVLGVKEVNNHLRVNRDMNVNTNNEGLLSSSRPTTSATQTTAGSAGTSATVDVNNTGTTGATTSATSGTMGKSTRGTT